MGRVGFIKEKLKELKTQVESDEISYRKELNVGIEPDIIIEEVARRYKKNPGKLINSKTRPAVEKQIAIYLIRRYTGLKRGDREDIQDEGTGGKQGGYKDRKVDGGKQEDKESCKEANFDFPGLTPFFRLQLSVKDHMRVQV